MDITLDIGINRIYSHNMKLTQRLIDGAKDMELDVVTPYDRKNRGSIVNIQMNNSREKSEELKKRGFIQDARANGIRLAPHFYNNFEDVDKIIEAISIIK